MSRQWVAARGPATGVGARLVTGIVEVVSGGRILGGNLFPANATQIDLNSAAFQEPGFAPVNNRPWFLYLVTPFGLPRWAKYTPASAGVRKPLSPSGIPVLSMSGPRDSSGSVNGAAPIALPAATGLGGSSQVGQVILSGAYGSTGFWTAAHVEGRKTVMRNDGTTQFGTTVVGVLAGATTTFALPDNTTHPAHATSLRCRFAMSFSGAANSDFSLTTAVESIDADGTNPFFRVEEQFSAKYSGVGGYARELEVDVPIYPNVSGAPVTRTIKITTIGATPGAAATIQILGWQLQP